jgi:hypothetical protein
MKEVCMMELNPFIRDFIPQIKEYLYKVSHDQDEQGIPRRPSVLVAVEDSSSPKRFSSLPMLNSISEQNDEDKPSREWRLFKIPFRRSKTASKDKFLTEHITVYLSINEETKQVDVTIKSVDDLLSFIRKLTVRFQSEFKTLAASTKSVKDLNVRAMFDYYVGGSRNV